MFVTYLLLAQDQAKLFYAWLCLVV